MESNNKRDYFNQSVSPIEYATNNLKGKMRAANWNVINDDKDLEVWNRITPNFWLPEKVAVSNDLPSWNKLEPSWQDLVVKTFTGLTLLDTIQATIGDVAQVKNAITDHEQVIYTNFAFMVGVHARSYGTIFSTFCTTEQINAAHDWVINCESLQKRAQVLIPCYTGDDPLKSKVAAALMPGFLLYGGFYLPFYLATKNLLPNTLDIIRLILRDKVIHNYYSGYKYQKKFAMLAPEKQKEMKDFVFGLLNQVIQLEKNFLNELYEGFNIVDDSIKFSLYNAGKFLQNLGYDSPFTPEETAIKPEILVQLSARADENHDFFSGSGSSYIMGNVVETDDDDWDF